MPLPPGFLVGGNGAGAGSGGPPLTRTPFHFVSPSPRMKTRGEGRSVGLATACNRGRQTRNDRLLGQHLIAERQRAQTDLRVARMEPRGDAAAVRIEEIGDGGILGTALARDGAGENPGMPIGGQPFLARLQCESAA